MSEGYTIVNGQKVEGRTLSFDSNGLKVGSNLVVKSETEEKDIPLRIEEKENKIGVKNMCYFGFGFLLGFTLMTGLRFLKRKKER